MNGFRVLDEREMFLSLQSMFVLQSSAQRSQVKHSF